MEIEDKIILYSSKIERLETILNDEFNDSEYILKTYNSKEDIYDYIDCPPSLMINSIDEEDLIDDIIVLADYFSCPKVCIFEEKLDLTQSAELLSQNQIYGIVRDSLLDEKLTQLFFKLGIIEKEIDYLTIDQVELKTEMNLLIHAESISEGRIFIKKPGIEGIGSFSSEELTLFLKQLGVMNKLIPEQLFIENEDVLIETDTTQVMKLLNDFQFESDQKISIAFIKEDKPNYDLLRQLRVKINHYPNLESYKQEEDLVIIYDKILAPKETTGTRFVSLEENENKQVLIYNRILPLSKYTHNFLSSTTSKQNLKLLYSFIQKNKPSHSDNKYEFSAHNNLSSGVLRLQTQIISMSECYLKLLCPLKITPSSRVRLPFLGRSTFSVVSSEKFQNQYIIELHIDSFSENELSHLRRTIYKLYFLNSKSVDLSQFESIEEVFRYRHIEEESGP